jgi:predicted small secreted protein
MTRISLILLATLALAACETVEGAGKDLQSAGQAVQQEANQAQEDM